MTIASVQSQTLKAWELIVVDDHSTDETRKVVERLAAEDPRISFHSQEPAKKGAPAARNSGLAKARGEYVLFLDSDDLLAAACLENRLTAFGEFPECDFVVGLASLFGDQPDPLASAWREWSEEDDLQRFLRFNEPWQTTGPLWRRTTFKRLRPWNEALGYYQDWELSARALSGGIAYRRLETVDYYIRRDERPRISGNRQSAGATCELIDAVADFRGLPRSDEVRFWLPSICLNLTRRHAFLGSLPEAMCVWRHCRKNRYVKSTTFASALPLLVAVRSRIAVSAMQRFAGKVGAECFPVMQ